jgi:hypothetical protein
MAYGTLNAGTITPGSGNTLSINESVAGTAILDEDAMGSDSATQLATQQSIKAYVDSAASQATTAAQGVGTGDSPTFTGLNVSDGNITNVGDIALDTISSDAGTSIGVTLGTDAGDDFNVGSGKLVVEGDSGNVGINTSTPSAKLHIKKASTGSTLILQDYNTNPSFAALLEVKDSAGVRMFSNGSIDTSISAIENVLNCCMRMSKAANSGRSLNAAGTVNASGADYAEYEIKRDDCGVIKKGDVCGFDSAGLLTDKWILAKTFGIKSTDPSYVGGDSWGSAEKVGEEPEETESESFSSFEIRLKQFKENLEIERQKVDRIAYSGKVPCNLETGQVGDFVIPIKDIDGISGMTVTAPTLEQYIKAVGQIISVNDDVYIVAIKKS